MGTSGDKDGGGLGGGGDGGGAKGGGGVGGGGDGGGGEGGGGLGGGDGLHHPYTDADLLFTLDRSFHFVAGMIGNSVNTRSEYMKTLRRSIFVSVLLIQCIISQGLNVSLAINNFSSINAPHD